MKAGDVFGTRRFGNVTVVNYRNAKSVLVEFANTGWVGEFEASKIRAGTIRDLLGRSVLGVGFIGDGPYSKSAKTKHRDAYKRWSSMLTRCYSNKYLKTRPTYLGCHVCDEWHNFQTFADWFYKNAPDNVHEYDIDKDILVSGNKLYSPSTCIFVKKSINAVCGVEYNYEFTSPEGNDFSIGNLNEFCKKNDLDTSHMASVHHGKRKSHKGWVKK